MATKNQWLTSNIEDRLTNKTADFFVKYKVSNITHNGFLQECKNVCEDIKNTYKKIYVAFSGGLDSEFVMKCFGKSATPIIVDTPGNKLESSYAYYFCKVNKITPVVIKKTEKEMLNAYYELIFKNFNGIGYDATSSYFAGKYAVENGGVAVLADEGYFSVNEWDYYNDVLIGEGSNLQFLVWTPELTKAMQEEWIIFKKENNLNTLETIGNYDDCHQEFKCKLYGIAYRPKMVYNYSQNYKFLLNKIHKSREVTFCTEDFINI
jgi:hypothetical protein